MLKLSILNKQFEIFKLHEPSPTYDKPMENTKIYIKTKTKVGFLCAQVSLPIALKNYRYKKLSK